MVLTSEHDVAHGLSALRAADLASARRIIFVRIQKVGTKSLSAVSLGLADAVVRLARVLASRTTPTA